ncbi:MAG TPA: hypothetical protein VGF79_08655, partial [Bacteroidia bacterium]
MKKDLEKLIELAQNESAIFNADELLQLGLSKTVDPTHPSKIKPKFTLKAILISTAAIVVSLFIVDAVVKQYNYTSEQQSNESFTNISNQSADVESNDTASSMGKNDFQAQSDQSNISLATTAESSINSGTISPEDKQATLMPSTLQPLKGDVYKLLKLQSLPAQVYTINT